ncbi:hypothetical protein [Pelotomaculum sp. PtaB.Bin117]|uniref:hypothetical protein n=1 Tax=Pelotomaculum sp. PtaB.Bin117 TaxID=1811694 RepID=UPI0009CB658A|nr:hypothetical protein [Pelotomaculum sp. PtaB.Bin117]OPX87412.1 MAG: hypothetical protein A4E54_01694 [Pelotomaculum sp. PtaB.Bin117]OPY61086.1 MAG: hypothetical protein A4E56_02288 [Pelotomaculum sp. PtaU1.Bin065]
MILAWQIIIVNINTIPVRLNTMFTLIIRKWRCCQAINYRRQNIKEIFHIPLSRVSRSDPRAVSRAVRPWPAAHAKVPWEPDEQAEHPFASPDSFDKSKKPSSSKRKVSYFYKEPVMNYATAIINPCIAQNNLSTAENHYGTYNDLCSTIMNT